MSLSHAITDGDRKVKDQYGQRFALVLLCVALALVVFSALSPSVFNSAINSEVSLNLP
jgi:hypothetical protein